MIKIKESKKGSLRKITKTAPGKKIPLAKEQKLKSSGTPAERKKANFAINARKWEH